MNGKKIYGLLSLVVIVSMLLASCASAPTDVPATDSAATQAPATEVPTSSRTGAWVDSIVISGEDSAEAAITRMANGETQLHADAIAEAPAYELLQQNSNLTSSKASGSSNTIMFNPAEFSDGRLNPFSIRKVREAMHYMLDRDHVVQEIYKGLAFPRYTALTTVFPDYARYADIIRALESKYKYNPQKADEIVTAELTAAGAEKVDGKWMYKGEPIVLIAIIRVEDNRKLIGDYFAGQMESLGFTVDRQFKTRSEASPIWNQSTPTDGLWNFYTAGWIAPSIDRDEGDQFSAYFTNRGSAGPLWQAYVPNPDLDAVALKLESNDFSNLEERRELFAEALPLSMEESYQIWCVDEAAFVARSSSLVAANDLAGGVQGSQVWGQILRYQDQEGGTVNITQPGIFVEPWNAIAGTNWILDSFPQRATSDNGLISDPFTGLAWTQRMDRAEVTVLEGLPVTKTLDWLSLDTASEITVPEDAWVDWDAKNQKFITAGEKFPEGLKSNSKVVVYYPADLYDTITWHDGSPISAADFVMNMIQVFDQAYADSPIYDEASVGATEGFLSHFKGVKIVSTNPLVIETYDDFISIDAEVMVSNNQVYPNATWWPQYAYGEVSWHGFALGYLAEENKELAFSTDKASALGVEWTSYISGPSLEILKKHLDQAKSEAFVPYAATLKEFLGEGEAAARYEAMDKFYADHGHFWVNTGPFVLDQVFPVEGSMTLTRYESYPDRADKWSRFGEPKIAVVEADGPGQVTAGTDATFDAFVTFKEEPYASADVSEVKYLVFNTNGELVASGNAEFIAEGKYQAVVAADITSQLGVGANRIEFVVVPAVVSIPSFASFDFVVSK